jgi:hypothetical protein
VIGGHDDERTCSRPDDAAPAADGAASIAGTGPAATVRAVHRLGGAAHGAPVHAVVTVIRLRLSGFERTIGIEVWDSGTEVARLPVHDQAGELRALAVVDARAED